MKLNTTIRFHLAKIHDHVMETMHPTEHMNKIFFFHLSSWEYTMMLSSLVNAWSGLSGLDKITNLLNSSESK